MTARWTEDESRRFELALEVLSDEIGRRNVALNGLPEAEAGERTRLREEQTRIVHLSNRLRADDERRVEAILERDLDEAFRDGGPVLRRAM